MGFSPKAAYIFLKQIEEADVVVVNKIDKLSDAEREELLRLVRQRFPGKQVLAASARQGEGFEQLVAALDGHPRPHASFMEVDYDVYAEGEAELGWLNSAVRVTAGQPFALDDLLLDLVGRLKETLAAEDYEPAHLKAIGLWEGFFGVANLVASSMTPELSLPSNCQVKNVDLVVNARVACDPQRLTELVQAAVTSACTAVGASAEFGSTQSFRPGRPTPTHRVAAAK